MGMIMWYQGIRMFERLSVPKKLLVMGLYILFLPILSFIQLAAPNSKVSWLMQRPCFKFTTQIYSYMSFLILVILFTVSEKNTTSENQSKFKSVIGPAFSYYQSWLYNETFPNPEDATVDCDSLKDRHERLADLFKEWCCIQEQQQRDENGVENQKTKDTRKTNVQFKASTPRQSGMPSTDI